MYITFYLLLCLKIDVSVLEENNKICAICFDEMTLKKTNVQLHN